MNLKGKKTLIRETKNLLTDVERLCDFFSFFFVRDFFEIFFREVSQFFSFFFIIVDSSTNKKIRFFSSVVRRSKKI